MTTKRILSLILIITMMITSSSAVLANEAEVIEEEILEEVIEIEDDSLLLEDIIYDEESEFIFEGEYPWVEPLNTILADMYLLEQYYGDEHIVTPSGDVDADTLALQSAIDAASMGDIIVIEDDITIDGVRINKGAFFDVLFMSGTSDGEPVQIKSTILEYGAYKFSTTHFDVQHGSSSHNTTLSFLGVELVGQTNKDDEIFSGGISSGAGKLTLNGLVMKDCSMGQDKSVIEASGHVILNDCIISNCYTPGIARGCILTGELTITNSKIEGLDGGIGAIAVTKKLVSKNSEICNNASYAAIYITAGGEVSEFEDVDVLENDGIAIFAESEISVKNSRINANGSSGIESNKNVSVTSSFIQDNASTGVVGAEVTILGSRVEENKLGGIVAETVNISNSVVGENINGSGILAAIVNAENTIIRENRARDGSGIYSSENVNLQNVEISGNIASRNGGGVYSKNITFNETGESGKICGSLGSYYGTVLPKAYVFDAAGELVTSLDVERNTPFEVTLPSGVYSVVIHKKNHTPHVFYNIAINGNNVNLSDGATLHLYGGDMDENEYEYKVNGKTIFTGGDGIIDDADRNILDEYYYLSDNADINDDTFTNALDLSIMLGCYYSTGQSLDFGGNHVGIVEKTLIKNNEAGIDGGGIYFYKPAERSISGTVFYEGLCPTNLQPAQAYLLDVSNELVQKVDVNRGERFEFTDVPNGTYNIVLHKKNHKYVKITDVIFDGNSVALTGPTEKAFRLQTGEVDGWRDEYKIGDGHINTSDLSLVYNAMMNNLADPQRYDLNDDGVVNYVDMIYIYKSMRYGYVLPNQFTFAQINTEVVGITPITLDGMDITNNTAAQNGGGVYIESEVVPGSKIYGTAIYEGYAEFSLVTRTPAMVHVFDEEGEPVTSVEAVTQTIESGRVTVTFEVELPAGLYNIVIHKKNNTPRVFYNVLVHSNGVNLSESGIIRLYGGDMDANEHEYKVNDKTIFTGGNGKIESADQDILDEHYFERTPENLHDIIEDGEVGALDKSLQNSNFNKTVPIIDYEESNSRVTFKNGTIRNNIANADGGGIYIDDLSELAIESEAIFSNNEAIQGFDLDLAGSVFGLLHNRLVRTTVFTTPYTNAYSNDDVNFTGVILTYKANGGKGADILKPYVPGETFTVLANPFSKVSSTFNGWIDDAEISFEAGSTFVIDQDTTLYATWVANGGGGTGGGGGAEKPEPKPEDEIERGILQVDCFYGEKLIYQEIINTSSGKIIDTKAPRLTGYKLSDELEKSITIASGINIVTFKYDVSKGFVNGRPGLVLDLRNHIKYILGYPDGSVQPDGSITRAEAAAIFYRLLDSESVGTAESEIFSDVATNTWYAQAVNYLAENEIILGYPDGTFKPNATITRAEFASIASRFDMLEELDENMFTDVNSDHWAFIDISSAAAKGWISGFPDGTFKPNDYITRVQVVVIVNKMLNRKIHLEDVPANVIHFTDLPISYWGYTNIVEASNEHDFEKNEDGYELWILK